MSVMLGLMLMQAASDAPLQPSGKWTVEYEDTMCALSRQFGVGEAAVTFGLKPNGLRGETAQVVLLFPDKGSPYQQTYKAQMELQPSGAQFPAEVWTWVFPAKGMRIVQFTANPEAQKAMAVAQIISLPSKRGKTISIAPANLPAALRALDVCQRDLLVSFGVDRPAQDAVVEPAEAIGGDGWITHNDYPVDALRRGKSGTVVILWRISPEGRVVDCKVVQAAEEVIFGEVSCGLLTRRGRFKPARDAADKPVSSWGMRRIVWSVPRY